MTEWWKKCLGCKEDFRGNVDDYNFCPQCGEVITWIRQIGKGRKRRVLKRDGGD